jgi:hypothetical protein
MAAKTGTYTLIASNTLSSTSATVTFSSIPATFTDLVLICSPVAISTENNSLRIRFNGDTGNNYSVIILKGTGSSASTNFEANISSGYAGAATVGTTIGKTATITQIIDYSNATTFKTFLERSNNSGVDVIAGVGLWRSTSVINSIELALGSTFPSQNFASGSTFKLYGIEAGNL